MSNLTVSPSHGTSAKRQLLVAAGLSAFLLLWPAMAVGATEGPFRPFLGNWRGAGAIVAADGHKEQVTCRATYAYGENVVTLTQSLVCASASYRFDVESRFAANGNRLQGQWQETTRNIAGSLSGQVGDGDFEGTVTGANFTAQISVRSNRSQQVVSIRPSAGDIASVEVSLQHRR